jgi:hypothetical protein
MTRRDEPRECVDPLLARRAFLGSCGVSLGAIALAGLERLALGSGAVAPRARRVIYVHLSGAPPQHDLFDCKPQLQRFHGTKCPESMFAGRRLAFTRGHPTLLGTPHPFDAVGESGALVTRLLPRLREQLHRTTLVRSMTTDQFNHAPAELLLFTGSPQFGGASLGSWLAYGLGSENRDLPAFMVMISGDSDPTGGKALWSSGFLPSQHQGVPLRSRGEPILFASDPPGMDRATRRSSLDALARLNSLHGGKHGDPETSSRIAQYELAFRMQASVPGLLDLAAEPETIRDEYGARPGESSFANHCLLARRLVEAGVRFVQLFDWGWDVHGTGPGDDLLATLPRKCREIDRPLAALLLDLDRRGMLDETLVVIGGEFGRTPFVEARDGSRFLGRDHHPDCFSMLLAGAGIQRGRVFGATDELGHAVTEDPVTIRDLQATILYLVGLDPHRFAFPYQGLDQRLIGPTEEGRVRHELFGAVAS